VWDGSQRHRDGGVYLRLQFELWIVLRRDSHQAGAQAEDDRQERNCSAIDDGRSLPEDLVADAEKS